MKRSKVFATSEMIIIKGKGGVKKHLFASKCIVWQLCYPRQGLYVKKKVQVRGKEGEKDLGGSIFRKVFV
jgi:hypothetical protein